jgi:hypothetical protein
VEQNHDIILELCVKIIKFMKKGNVIQFDYRKVENNELKKYIIAPLQIRLHEDLYYLFGCVYDNRNLDYSLKNFRVDMIPLTGSIEELNKVASIFKASFSKVPIESNLKYTIDHTTSVYLVDREGNYIEKIPHGIPFEAFVGYLKKHL